MHPSSPTSITLPFIDTPIEPKKGGIPSEFQFSSSQDDESFADLNPGLLDDETFSLHPEDLKGGASHHHDDSTNKSEAKKSPRRSRLIKISSSFRSNLLQSMNDLSSSENLNGSLPQRRKDMKRASDPLRLLERNSSSHDKKKPESSEFAPRRTKSSDTSLPGVNNNKNPVETFLERAQTLHNLPNRKKSKSPVRRGRRRLPREGSQQQGLNHKSSSHSHSNKKSDRPPRRANSLGSRIPTRQERKDSHNKRASNPSSQVEAKENHRTESPESKSENSESANRSTTSPTARRHLTKQEDSDRLLAQPENQIQHGLDHSTQQPTHHREPRLRRGHALHTNQHHRRHHHHNSHSSSEHNDHRRHDHHQRAATLSSAIGNDILVAEQTVKIVALTKMMTNMQLQIVALQEEVKELKSKETNNGERLRGSVQTDSGGSLASTHAGTEQQQQQQQLPQHRGGFPKLTFPWTYTPSHKTNDQESHFPEIPRKEQYLSPLLN